MKIKEVKERHESACNEYVKLFCKKQGIEFDFWIGDEIGGIASFIQQYYFTISDIALDLNTRQPKHLILSWHNDSVDYSFKHTDGFKINYLSYTMGLRYTDLKKKEKVRSRHQIMFD